MVVANALAYYHLTGNSYGRKKACSTGHRGLFYKTLRTYNVRQMNIFCSKQMFFYIASHKHTSLNKHTSVLWNPYITNIVQPSGHPDQTVKVLGCIQQGNQGTLIEGKAKYSWPPYAS